MDEPTAFATTEDPVVMNYKFCVERSVGVKNQRVSVHIYNNLERTVVRTDGKQRTYTKEDDPKKPFYTLIVDTSLGFSEALAKFREMGVTGKARIPLLSYGGNVVRNMRGDFLDKIDKMARGEEKLEFESRSEYQPGKPNETVRYHDSPFVVADLDSAFVSDVEKSAGVMFMRIDCEKSPVTDDFSLTYQKDKITDGFQARLQTRIGYMDDKVVSPRFHQLLDTASFELSEKEKDLLEEMVRKAVLL